MFFFLYLMWDRETVVSAVTSHQEGLWFEAQLGPSCVRFACSPCVHGFHLSTRASSHRPQSKDMLGEQFILNWWWIKSFKCLEEGAVYTCG